ncbi:hypothetical protein B0H11DRAFT_549291 [Mycena galericulata]|nr:hypothetical protein B0H11DRAFT_549291 [Mycena galericulata]
MDIDTDTHRRPRKRMRRSPSPSPSSHFSRPSCSPPRATSTTALTSPATTSTSASASPSTPPPPPTPPSPLLALPPELLTLIALHLATTPPNLGPPAALLPLLLTCRAVYERLTWRAEGGRGLWVRVGGAKFAVLPPALDFLEDFEDFEDDFAPSGFDKQEYAPLRALHTHLTTLRVLRTGDPYHPLAARALRNAYWMLVADGGPGAHSICTASEDDEGKVLDRIGLSSGTPSLASLGLVSSTSASTNFTSTAGGRTPRTGAGIGKNRRQLAWAGARAFALRWVRERLWEGRFGERGACVFSSFLPFLLPSFLPQPILSSHCTQMIRRLTRAVVVAGNESTERTQKKKETHRTQAGRATRTRAPRRCGCCGSSRMGVRLCFLFSSLSF